jgi:hypothetical protein
MATRKKEGVRCQVNDSVQLVMDRVWWGLYRCYHAIVKGPHRTTKLSTCPARPGLMPRA